MALTFANLRTEALQWLDEASAGVTDSSYLNVQYALKQAHTIRLTEDNWKFMLWPRVESFSTTTATTYALHQEFLRPYWFRNTTRKLWLRETPGRNIDADGIDYANDTDTDMFQLGGRQPLAAQPTSASTISIVSSSASDTTAAKAITIYGDTASGMVSESLTPNGTTPVASTNSFTTIISVTKGADWVGTMTMTSNSGAVTNLTLLPTEYGRSYPTINLLYNPTSGQTVQYRFYRRPKELSADNDITDIPSPFERIVVYDALMLMAAYDNRIESNRVSIWQSMRDQLDFQMRQTFIEGQSIGAEPRMIGGGNNSYVQRVQFPE